MFGKKQVFSKYVPKVSRYIVLTWGTYFGVIKMHSQSSFLGGQAAKTVTVIGRYKPQPLQSFASETKRSAPKK